jgi:hypothetical protein
VIGRRSKDSGVPAGMVAAEKLAGQARRQDPPPAEAAGDAETLALRDRLVERFALLQSELGGLYYEMAIRDSIRDDLLRHRAVELQRVDLELARLDRILRGDAGVAADACPSCHATVGRADQFCASCGRPVLAPPTLNGNGNGHH